MTGTQPINSYDLFRRYFQNESDAKAVVEEVQSLVKESIEAEKKDLSSKNEVSFSQTDLSALKVQVDNLKTELKSEIEKSALRVENNLKSEINKLIIWIVATVFATSALMLGIAKLLF